MENESELLLKKLSLIYRSSDVKNDDDIKLFLFESAKKLNQSEEYSEELYSQAIVILSQGISYYYFSHDKKLPQVISDLYKSIRPEIQKMSLNSKDYRNKAVGQGAIYAPLIFF